MPDRDRYELLDGQLVEKTISFWSSYIATEFLARTRECSRGHQYGWVVSEGTTYQCFPDDPGNDLAYDVDSKVQDWQRAGVRLIWVVKPQSRTVEVHRPRGAGTILHENDDIEGEDVLPGFRCPIRELFLPPPGVVPAS
jgi:Uma2 family endonuclease